MLTAADRTAMLEATGEEATSLLGVIQLVFSEPGQTIETLDGRLLASEPGALVSTADIASHYLVGDPDGSVLTIRGLRYEIKTIIPDGDGFAALELREP